LVNEIALAMADLEEEEAPNTNMEGEMEADGDEGLADGDDLFGSEGSEDEEEESEDEDEEDDEDEKRMIEVLREEVNELVAVEVKKRAELSKATNPILKVRKSRFLSSLQTTYHHLLIEAFRRPS
jgi:transcription initiation factor TFIID subunit 7